MTLRKTGVGNDLYDSLITGGLATITLTLFFIFSISEKGTTTEMLLAIPFFVMLYFTQFTIGRAPVIRELQRWIGKNRLRMFLFPTLMLIFYVVWMLFNGQDLLKGKPWLLLYIIYLPVVLYALANDPSRKIGWLDFTVFVLALLPSGFLSIGQNSEIPIKGGGFDSVSHVMIILTGAYVFAIVRGVKDVGFVPELKWKSLLTALIVWAAFYLVVFIFGTSVNFVKVIGHNDSFDVVFKSVVFSFIATFLHTALFEELFFRGILQNMLAKRISQGKSWQVFWQIGFVVLFIGAILVGYTLEGKMKWFPALVTALMFGAAYFLEKSGKHGMGVYTSLAVTGAIFGLVHYHAKSIIYIGFACLAGWAYGYTYIRTKNVFYSAVVHALVGTGALIFGLKLIM
jgi:uncharacterized protein